MQLSMNNPVLVPIMLEALVVGKDGIMADSVPDYSRLRNSQAFGNAIENGYFTTRPMAVGVHLHWTVPDALLTGEESKDGSLVFPQLPNRWILFRFAHGQDHVETCCFMIESDYVTNSAPEQEWGKTTLPTFCLRNGQWEGAGQKGELFGYVGEAWEYGKPRPGQDGYYLDQFTAVESGEPAFAAYYPGCSTMLGFCDRLPKQADSLSLTYLVAGYYADSNKDPLAGITLEQLKQMGFELKDEAAQKGAAADGMLCHGMLTHVVWKGADVSYENGVPGEDIEVYVGDTSAEALAALMQQELPEVSGLERMVRILQYNLMGRLEDSADEDALIQVEELLHEKKFQPESGGIYWNVCKEDENNAVTLTQQELEVLRQQNRREKQIEQEERTLSSLVQEAYSMAWKYINVCNDPFLNAVSNVGDFADIADKTILKEEIGAEDYRQQAELLLSQAEELSARLAKERAERKNFCTEQTEYFKAKKLKLCAQQAQRYYVAAPPALLLAGDGVKRSFKQGYQKAANGMLPCRRNPIRQLTVRDGGKTLQISGVKLSETTGVRALNLPAPIQGLAEECLLLDADNVELLARFLWEKTPVTGSVEPQTADNRTTPVCRPQITDEQIALVRKAQQEALAGESAPYSLANRSYSPVWNPLFMDWEVDIAPAGAPGQEKTPATQGTQGNVTQGRQDTAMQGRQDTAMQEFVLGEIDLETDRECNWKQNRVTIQGSCMILPHAVDNLGNMIEQLIKDCGGEKEYADLKAAAARLRYRDILSQQLDGFSEVLVMLEKRHCFPIMKEPDDPEFDTLAEGLNSLLFPDFCAKSPRIEKTQEHFLPLRAGVMRINKLRIIGSFGQVKNIKLEPERLHIAEDLRCQVSHAALLRPRFPQPCRIDLTWLAPDGSMPIIEQWENPVIGYLIPDFLDKNIQIFNPQGTLLGMIQVVPEGAKWMPLPWKMTRPENWQEGELRTFVQAVLKEPARARELLACMEQGFDLMAGNKNIRAVCFGNVLALVRASISVEMSGNPCIVQDWGIGRDSAGYEEEFFAVGIGDARKRQDGVMGYFGSGQSGIDYETFCFCRGKTQGHYAVAQNTLTLSLKARETEVILMMDPYKEVTLRTGFLPAWSKKLPIQGFQEDIGKLEGLLRMMPVLQNPQNFGFLTPAGEKGWSFIHAQGQETKMFTDLKEVMDGIDERSVTVMEGFLTAGRGLRMDINYSVSPTYVKAGKCQDLELFISNCTNDDIWFYNIQQIEACAYPTPETENAKRPDGFYLYFLYGTGGANMVSVADAVNIEVSLKEGRTEKWSVDKGSSKSNVGTYWVVAPKENVVFERGEELIVSIKNIKADADYGMAPLCLMYCKAGVKSKQSIGILKYYPPVIKKFDISERQYKAGSKVTLCWELEYAENCGILVDDKPQEKEKGSLTISSAEERHHIDVSDEKGNIVKQSITLPIIDSFAEATQQNSRFLTMEEVEDELTESFIQVPYAAPGPPTPPVVYKDVRVSWKTHNTAKCTIDSLTGTDYPKEGTATVKIRKNQMQLTLYAHDDNNHTVYQTINLKQ